MCEAHSSYNN